MLVAAYAFRASFSPVRSWGLCVSDVSGPDARRLGKDMPQSQDPLLPMRHAMLVSWFDLRRRIASLRVVESPEQGAGAIPALLETPLVLKRASGCDVTHIGDALLALV